MAFIEYEFNFSGTQGTPPANGTPQAIASNSATNSSNIYDAGSAKWLFAGGAGRGPKLSVEILKTTLGTSPTMTVQFVGADDAALTSNVITIVQFGPTRVLTAADFPMHLEAVIPGQIDKKRYYGIIYTIGGSGSPSYGFNANIVADSQSSGTGSGGANLQP